MILTTMMTTRTTRPTMRSGVMLNKCNQCDNASLRAGDLKTHLKTHSGEKSKVKEEEGDHDTKDNDDNKDDQADDAQWSNVEQM